MSGTIFINPAAAERHRAALAFLAGRPAGTETLIIGSSRGAADDLARSFARSQRATFGLHRFSLTQLAARLAATRLASRGLAPATGLGTAAVAARAVFEANGKGELQYFAPVAEMPGFPRSLARTLTDLRMAAVAPDRLESSGQSGADLAALHADASAQLAAAGAADRAMLFHTAREALVEGRAFCRGAAVLLLDVPVETTVESQFVLALLGQASDWIALVPEGDERTRSFLETMASRTLAVGPGKIEVTPAVGAGIVSPSSLFPGDRRATPEPGAWSQEPEQRPQPEAGSLQPESDLASLRRFLFSSVEPPLRERGDDVVFFSAPGEGREAVEIARYILDEARRGVRFDEMAVFLRSPREYLGLIEHAFARAGIPVWLGRGTRRPHPAGRALLALLSCADENLSAHRFAEYLSLAQVPASVAGSESGTPDSRGPGVGQPVLAIPRASREGRPDSRGAGVGLPRRSSPESEAKAGQSKRPIPRPGDSDQLSLFDVAAPVRPVDDALATGAQRLERGDLEPAEPDETSDADEPDASILHGSIRAPYKWEEWLNESAVIAGRDRWHRLDGAAAELQLKLKEARREDPSSAKTAAIERDLGHLEHLRAFALPLIDEFAAWPKEATWREWLERLEALVPRVIRQPLVVQRVLAELRPMGGIGPVTLSEVRDVLSERLRTVAVEPPDNRYGRVFVGTADGARGRAFRIVFVPGLAERVFPQKLREDPLLADDVRRRIDPSLEIVEHRSAEERLLLRLAVGAATERVYISYPRVELREARPRVPSFYGLDVFRAITGRVPGHEELQALAARETKTTLAWPAPETPARAVDDVEHDLAVLAPLLRAPDPTAVRGHARYLLDLNDHLRRSLTERWQRHKPAWTASDGLVKATDIVKAALAGQRLAARPYSLTALQRYASCPYQFLLQAIYRLEPFEEPTPLQRLDPLTKGGLFHAIQAAFYRERQSNGALPITRDNLAESLEALDLAVHTVSESEREKLAPAVDRVWRDEIAAIRKDLRRWVALQAGDEGGWTPERFELSFGLEIDPDHDPHSVRQPVTVDGRFVLRGSIDLVERNATSRTLRVTDHKTGKNRTEATTTINGGRTLQPVLYSLVVEAMTGETVSSGRLYYCTEAGKFTAHTVQLGPVERDTGKRALEIVDRGIELAFLAASPDEGACEYCDFRPVCGSGEEKRAKKKNQGAVQDLQALRDLP